MLTQFKQRLIKTMQLPAWYKPKKFDIEIEKTEKFVKVIRYSSLSYEQLVNIMVRQKYDYKQEKQAELVEDIEYLRYLEECKKNAQEFIDERILHFGK